MTSNDRDVDGRHVQTFGFRYKCVRSHNVQRRHTKYTEIGEGGRGVDLELNRCVSCCIAQGSEGRGGEGSEQMCKLLYSTRK